ncbi:MAG: chemotaxis protein CheW [Bacteroidales bacterium]|nr:chemotaxis protein CheW [Bacteroidales bacterium]
MDEKQKANQNSYLTFRLGKELFAADVRYVLHILPVPEITEVPNSTDYMKGVINHGGKVLPVVDTRVKFNMPQVEKTKNTCIIVVEINSNNDTINVGAVVDSVHDVLEISDEQIQPQPGIGSKYQSEFIDGMIKEKDEFIILLNMNKVFSAEEVDTIVKTPETGNQKPETKNQES